MRTGIQNYYYIFTSFRFLTILVLIFFLIKRLKILPVGLDVHSNRNEEISLKDQLKLIPYSKKRWEFQEDCLEQGKNDHNLSQLCLGCSGFFRSQVFRFWLFW